MKAIFWIWFVALVAINLIPIGNEINRLNSGIGLKELSFIRIDYLAHTTMMLVFAWIWVMGKIMRIHWFSRHEAIVYSSVVITACVCLELVQKLVPWRSFNPVDMLYNLLGGLIVVGIVFTVRGTKGDSPA